MSPWLQCSGFCYNAAAVLHNCQQTLPLQVLPPGATLSLSSALGEVKVWEGLPAASSSSPCRVFSAIASWHERKLIPPPPFFYDYFLLSKQSRQLGVDTSVKSLSLQNSLQWILWIIDEWYWRNFSLNVLATKQKLFTFFSFVFFFWSCSSRMVDYGRLLWFCSCQISFRWEKTNK